MPDFSLMIPLKLPVVDRIYPQSNTFSMGVNIKGKAYSKLNDSPDFNSVLKRIEQV